LEKGFSAKKQPVFAADKKLTGRLFLSNGDPAFSVIWFSSLLGSASEISVPTPSAYETGLRAFLYEKKIYGSCWILNIQHAQTSR